MAEWTPFSKGALYTQHAERWELEQDTSEMTLDVLKGGKYLPKFSDKELDGDYAYRKEMSAPLDMCRDAIRLRLDNIFRRPVKRDYENSPYKDLIAALVHNADADGCTLTDFMNKLAWQMYVTGADVVTQVESAPEGVEIRTAADTKDIHPYFLQFSPLARYDWAMRGEQSFAWARYCLGTVPPDDEKYNPKERVTEFLTVTATGWRRHSVTQREGDALAKVETKEGSGNEAILGRPPILKAYFAESAKPGQGGVPLSLLTRPSVIAKVLLNLKSQADADLLAAVTRWFLSGAQSEELKDVVYGPGTLIRIGDEKASITVAQGSADHIREKREWCMLYLHELLRLLGLTGGVGDVEGTQGSGYKVALLRTNLDNELRRVAEFLGKLELEMMRQAVVLTKGVEIAPEDASEVLQYEAAYNDDYILEPVGEMLKNLVAWVSQCGMLSEDVPGITKEMMRQLRGALVSDDSPHAEEIDLEIDKAELVAVGADAEPDAVDSEPDTQE